MQYANDLQESFLLLAPILLLAAGVVLAMLLILGLLALAYSAVSEE